MSRINGTDAPATRGGDGTAKRAARPGRRINGGRPPATGGRRGTEANAARPDRIHHHGITKMRIDTNVALTVAELRALILGADDTATVEFFKTPKKLLTGECWCGCGEATKSRFAPGHDSKFHSLAKRVARDTETMPESFVNEDAKADFMKWHDAEVPKHEARVAAKAEKAAAKEVAKAAKPAKPAPVVKDEAPVIEEGPTGQLDPESDEFKALMDEVSMS